MIKIVFIALVGVFVSIMLKKLNSNISFAVAVFTGVVIINLLYTDIANLVSVFESFNSGYGVSNEHIKLLLKIIGISYITQFGISIAEDCGEKLIAKKIELAGKIFMISLSIPIMLKLMNTIVNLI